MKPKRDGTKDISFFVFHLDVTVDGFGYAEHLNAFIIEFLGKKCGIGI